MWQGIRNATHFNEPNRLHPIDLSKAKKSFWPASTTRIDGIYGKRFDNFRFPSPDDSLAVGR